MYFSLERYKSKLSSKRGSESSSFHPGMTQTDDLMMTSYPATGNCLESDSGVSINTHQKTETVQQVMTKQSNR